MGLEPGQHPRLGARQRTLLTPGLIVPLRVGRPAASMPADAFQYIFEFLNSACRVGSGGQGHTLNQGHPVGPLSSWTGRPPLSRVRKGFKTALPEPCTRGCEDVLAVWGSGFREEAPRAGAATPPPPAAAVQEASPPSAGSLSPAATLGLGFHSPLHLSPLFILISPLHPILQACL